MTRNQNHDVDASSSSNRNRIMTFDNGDMATWSDVNHDVLFLVMMQLGFVDFFAFSGVCKSWRSFALSNRNMFMASKPPLSILHHMQANEDNWCHLKDFEGKKLKTIIPHFTNSICIGSTCGYLILLGKETRDFWLVNLITRHELHFPDYPLNINFPREIIRGILVFSRSISGWVFVVLNRQISFCIAGKRGWTYVSSFPILIPPISDLHFFKGKIYTMHNNFSLRELRLNLKQKRKWTLLKINNFPNLNSYPPLVVSSSENLFLINSNRLPENIVQLDFDEMKWVSAEKTAGEYAFFISILNHSAAIKPESFGPRTQHKRLDIAKGRQYGFFFNALWYFFHDCLHVNLIDE